MCDSGSCPYTVSRSSVIWPVRSRRSRISIARSPLHPLIGSSWFTPSSDRVAGSDMVELIQAKRLSYSLSPFQQAGAIPAGGKAKIAGRPGVLIRIRVIRRCSVLRSLVVVNQTSRS